MIKIDVIKEKLCQKLPGDLVRLEMAPPFRNIYQRTTDEKTKKSAVIILLHKEEDELKFPVIVRTNRGVHGGQVGLPGGHKHPDDLDFAATALRECSEELGINSLDIEIIGQLSELFIPVSNTLVYPYVGVLNGACSVVTQASEVASCHQLVLKDLQHSKKYGSIEIRPGVFAEVPYFEVSNLRIWGATAMILQEFICLCS